MNYADHNPHRTGAHVPRRLESTPGPYARAVASVINQLIQSRNISMNGLSQLVGKSNNYVGMRLRHQASFTLTDIEDIGRVLGFDPREFLTGIHTNTISQ